MSFQCHDLDRALELPELMPEARAHAEICPNCRLQLGLWSEISRVAPQLHQDWESPGLWQRIRAELDTAPRRQPVLFWRWAGAMAAALVAAVLLWQPWTGRPEPTRELLTDQALRDVQRAEAAYVWSIERLSAVAGPNLDRSSSDLAAAYREKLLVLDSAIADLRTHIETNRYNPYLRTQLAALYHEKQKTIEEWLKNATHS
jgi:hypothetical protein